MKSVDRKYEELANKGIKFSSFATGAEEPQELTAIDSYVSGHPNIKGLFAVDAGSTESTAKTMQKHGLHSKGVVAGGLIGWATGGCGALTSGAGGLAPARSLGTAGVGVAVAAGGGTADVPGAPAPAPGP